MDSAWVGIVGALAALCLGGCGDFPVRESQVEATLPAKTASIVVGETDRAEVRRWLGEPLAGSSYWRFDVIRIVDWNRGVLFLGYFPIPQWEKNEGFVLVTYGDDGRVLGVASGHRLYIQRIARKTAAAGPESMRQPYTHKVERLRATSDREQVNHRADALMRAVPPA